MEVKKKYLSFYYESQPEVADPVIDPKKTALLLVDLQKEFVSREIGDAKKLNKKEQEVECR